MLVFIDTEGEMQIKSLDQMETIVEKNSILSWDGWNVVEMYVSDKGATSKFGAYKNGKWHLKKVFTPSQNGWDIPDKYVK
jgi:hypothetical protein